MKFAGTVVLYNPENNLIENINSYLPFLDCLYVMDNSTKELEIIEKVKQIEKVKYISLDGNKGIAKALKVATETAIQDGYDILLSMDQDSKFPTEDFKYIEKYLTNNDISTLGIISINYSGNGMSVEDKNKDFVIDVQDVITSGSFIILENYKKIEGYNENLFIDLVDYDLCYKFKINGFNIKVFPNIILNHKLGNIKTIKFLCFDVDIVAHSPIRYYYMYRNYHYLLNHENEEYVKLLKTKSKEFGLKFKMLRFLLEKPHFKILKMIRKGIKDGKKGKIGPYQEKQKIVKNNK